MKKNAIIVTGASGFLGKNILRKFSENESIIALTTNVEKLKEFNNYPNITVMSNEEFLEKETRLIGSILINLAYSRSHQYDNIKASLDFSRQIVDKAILSGAKRIINISSQSVYDKYRMLPAEEDDIVNPSNLYGIGKYYLENLIRDICLLSNTEYVNLRIGSLVGYELKDRIINRLITNALKHQHIDLIEKNHVFSYTHVLDVAQAIIMLTHFDTKSFWNTVYNVGNEEFYYLSEIGNVILDQIYIKTNQKINLSLTTEIDAKTENNSINVKKFRVNTGWRAKWLLHDIIANEIDLQLKESKTINRDRRRG